MMMLLLLMLCCRPAGPAPNKFKFDPRQWCAAAVLQRISAADPRLLRSDKFKFDQRLWCSRGPLRNQTVGGGAVDNLKIDWITARIRP